MASRMVLQILGRTQEIMDQAGRLFDNAAMATYTLRVNGRTHQVDGDPSDSLLSVLRYELGLTGSKFGCGEGHCGACTVMIDDQPTRSCVARLGAVSGKTITTIEAFQCGYCTPGMVMATIGLLKMTPSPTEQDIARVLDRNVCRCGTYLRIVKAISLAAEKSRS